MLYVSIYCKFAFEFLKKVTLDLEQLVESILIKSKKLLNQRELLSEENRQLKNQIEDLQKAVLNQESIINDLIEKQKVQQVAGVFGKEEKKTSLKKIDEVVREIDRCMSLLNS